MVTSAQAVLGTGVLFLAVVIFRMRLIQMAQVLLARSCLTPLGQALSWRLELLACTRKHGPDYFARYFLMKLSIYLPLSFLLHHLSLLPASVGQSCFMRPSTQCAIVFFLPPTHVTLEFFFYHIHNVLFKNCFAFFFSISYYLSMSRLFIQIFRCSRLLLV